jgi:putative component of membrane protein insertase Oxa1/YidC/SpoIIIJ protein YidD
MGKAHERNRIKRRMREALRRHVDLLPAGFDLIFHPRRSVLTMEFAQLEAEIVRILEQARLEVTEAARGAQTQLGALRAQAPAYARTMTRILLALIAFYRRWLSPALHSLSPGGCKFCPPALSMQPSAIATHGPLRGSALAAWRLLALPSLCARRIRSCPARPQKPGPLTQSSRSIAPRPFTPTNRYHR